MKTAEEILRQFGLTRANYQDRDGSYFTVENIEAAMKAYASQAIDEILLKERGDVVPESEILKVKYNLK